jgi:hypothetical protein
MTPQERQLVDDLFDRLAKLENAPRDPDAVAAISQGLRKAPNAVYALVQTALLQDEALKRANSRIQELEAASPNSAVRRLPRFDARRDLRTNASRAVRCRTSAHPTRQPPGLEQRPGDAAGAGAGQYGQAALRPALYGGAAARQPWRAGGGGGSFLGTAAAAAAGVVGGSLLLGSIRSMMGGGHQGFGDSAASAAAKTAGRGAISPAAIWRAMPGSTTSAPAASRRTATTIRARLFDQASNDDDDDDDDSDDSTTDSTTPDFGGGRQRQRLRLKRDACSRKTKRPPDRAAVLFLASDQITTTLAPTPTRP